MNYALKQSPIRDIYDKVVEGQRISEADALRLFETKDITALGAVADFVRQRKNGAQASYILNRYINYSNYCILSCQFCAFSRKKRDADGFQFTIEEIVEKAREALAVGITELHIVGGLHPNLPFSYYLEMLRALRAPAPAPPLGWPLQTRFPSATAAAPRRPSGKYAPRKSSHAGHPPHGATPPARASARAPPNTR